MLIHQLPLDEAFAALRSAPGGLSHAEADARLVEFGANRIEGLPGTPLAMHSPSQSSRLSSSNAAFSFWQGC
jgi:hypothetical protein